MPVINSIADSKDEIAEYRHALHENPATSYEEYYASNLVAEKLKEWGIPYKQGIAKTGIVATIEGQKNDSGKSLGLRADIDALDITEKSGQPWQSKINGKMHACGHDGHTATLLAAAKHLAENRNFNGTVHLIFQPAEEGGRGAHTMIEEGLFKDFPCDYVFGLHNWPAKPLGYIGTRPGPMMASVDEFELTIHGTGGHAAMPEQTVDPVLIACQIVTALQSIVSRNVNPVDTAVLSVTNLNTGTGAFNIIPDTAVLMGTVRAFKQETREMIAKKIKTIASGIAESFGATIDLDYDFNIDPTINSADGAAMAASAAAEVVGANNVDANCEPTMGGEDFGAYLTHKPGAFIFVGQSLPEDKKSPHSHGLHNPHYDFNDDVIPIGASWFVKLTEQYLKLD